jgi:hypothetical protein
MERQGQRLFEEALRREPSDPRGALELLLCVQRFADKPAVALRIGTIAERLGKYELAARSFERYLALAGSAAPDREQMTEHIRNLREKIAGSRSATPAPPPPAPLPAQPAEPAGSRPPIAGWALAAGGGVLMALGGFLLWTAKQRSDDVHEIESGTTFWNSEQARSEFEQAEREQTLGILSLTLGAAAATVGVVLIVSADREVSAGASAGKGHGGATVRVRF